MFNGQIWAGPQHLGGEWGHHAVGPWWARDRAAIERGDALGPRPICYCGKRGCLELYASGVAVEADYARRAGQPLGLAEIARRRDGDPHVDS